MRILLSCLMLLVSGTLSAQVGSVSGTLIDNTNSPVPFANVILYSAADSSMAKVEATTQDGVFNFIEVPVGQYYVDASFIGFDNKRIDDVQINSGEETKLGSIKMSPSSVALAEAEVAVERPLVEILPDRTVFNVEGTVNNTGDNAFTLMRKAPGVNVDNNDNINVLGRAGVMVYVDGKQLPLSGEDLANYLKNLPSDQIDRIDIITNPGAKYDAEGNAGIIDIRLKKDKTLGANGSVRATYTQGQRTRNNANFTGNYRSKKVNVFGTAGVAKGEGFNDLYFDSFQNDLHLIESNLIGNEWETVNLRLGADFYLGEKSIIGVLANGMLNDGVNTIDNQVTISPAASDAIDSVLIANSFTNTDNTNQSYNLNYRYDDREKQRSLNVDLDWGKYSTDSYRTLPNIYFDAGLQNQLTSITNYFDTPTDIEIRTGRIDFENQLFGGKLGVGAKYSQVISDNTFLVFDDADGVPVQNDTLSNIFNYDEVVYAGYVSYNRQFGQKIGLSLGLRAEQTEATGDLQAFLEELREPPVALNYLRWFPSAGLTYTFNPANVLSVNYGRRINRPDYNVLNPFNNQLSQISYEKGNPRLQPEIVNNAEIGYTYQYRFNFKIAYSRTEDQITRLIGPDETDPRATFISWDNLATQTVWSFNASIPMSVTEKWSTFVNLSAAHTDNQADYGDGAIVDVQAYSYNIYTQNTITLPKGFKGEISGWFSGPGVWGGVFLYDPSWALNLGVSKNFFQDKLSVRATVNDIFYESGWSGISEFNGLISTGRGNWDSRFFSLSVGYNFGNQSVKSQRRRDTGLDSEADRVGS
ncbi:outer membrane beta-barrel family protein [Sanyastnella coralliicola]|uniref:outer membrane beta-barrel family protein n=1 Tax=Sanyastnella coralliicola TaxID=3069118 RepID=UPI0027B96936|nr:outer membrane beta-barrel family protein [Longitalea sp. SCSIO 12813]